jgi:hypothetical protein
MWTTIPAMDDHGSDVAISAEYILGSHSVRPVLQKAGLIVGYAAIVGAFISIELVCLVLDWLEREME